MKRTPPPPPNRKAPRPPQARNLPQKPTIVQTNSLTVEEESLQTVQRNQGQMEEEVKTSPVQSQSIEEVNSYQNKFESQTVQEQTIIENPRKLPNNPHIQKGKTGKLGSKQTIPPIPRVKALTKTQPVLKTTVQEQSHVDPAQCFQQQKGQFQNSNGMSEKTQNLPCKQSRLGLAPSQQLMHSVQSPSKQMSQAEQNSSSNSKLYQKLLRLRKAKEEMQDQDEDYSDNVGIEDESCQEGGASDEQYQVEGVQTQQVVQSNTLRYEQQFSSVQHTTKNNSQIIVTQKNTQISVVSITTLAPERNMIPQQQALNNRNVPHLPVNKMIVSNPPTARKSPSKPTQNSEPQQKGSQLHKIPYPVEQTRPSLPSVKLGVKIQQPQQSIMTEVSSLLEKYHSLKQTYKVNLHSLQEQINSQKRQEQAEVNQINRLMTDLSKKNEKIRALCALHAPSHRLNPAQPASSAI